MVKKKVKRFGNTLGINFSKEEQEIHNITEGCVIDISDFFVIVQPLPFDEQEADRNITKILKEANNEQER